MATVLDNTALGLRDRRFLHARTQEKQGREIAPVLLRPCGGPASGMGLGWMSSNHHRTLLLPLYS